MSKKNHLPFSTHYSESFKIKVVREYEQGRSTKVYLRDKYNIGGKSTVLEWCRRYGKLYYPGKGNQGRPMKDPEKQRIKDLESELREAKEKLKVYEKLLEISKREEGIDLIKNINTKLSKNWQSKEKK